MTKEEAINLLKSKGIHKRVWYDDWKTILEALELVKKDKRRMMFYEK